ncbi:MAG: 16S rRNA (uracil(1498)-N(3))-methyltransferase [Ruminococcaceae bacterium]|nr:16S rRNA (uracil(1498)-N(3))-methyltransferase [Oscillospiraceae bacterium]
MHKLFVLPEDIHDNAVTVTGNDVEHLHALRVKEGDDIKISDGVSLNYDAVVKEVRKNSVSFEILRSYEFENEPKIDITVYCALLKGGANEDVIKQAVELGANKIVFFSSSNCIAEKREKGEKYAKTARQAAMQAGRDRIPEVVSGVTFAEMIEGLAAADISAFFHEKADLPLYDVILTKKDPRSAAFAVGPEGGFTDKEAEIAIQKGIPVVSLGKRILRAVTAPLCALSVLTSVYDR